MTVTHGLEARVEPVLHWHSQVFTPCRTFVFAMVVPAFLQDGDDFGRKCVDAVLVDTQKSSGAPARHGGNFSDRVA